MKALMTAIQNALEVAKAHRDEAGRSGEGRYLSLAVTELEKAEDWVRRAAGLSVPRDAGYPSDDDLEEARQRGRDLQDK